MGTFTLLSELESCPVVKPVEQDEEQWPVGSLYQACLCDHKDRPPIVLLGLLPLRTARLLFSSLPAIITATTPTIENIINLEKILS